MPDISKRDRQCGRPPLRADRAAGRPKRIGIYAGSFDPVHAGHIAFALQSLQAARLDQVVFVPERRPRTKPGVEHYAHRVAMLKAAIRPYRELAVLEVVDTRLTVRRTLPQLKVLFPGSQLAFLMGSDAVPDVPQWQHAERMLQQSELVIGMRAGQSRKQLEQAMAAWAQAPQELTVFDSFAPHVSSGGIRRALRLDRHTAGLQASVRRYARTQWLYVSVVKSAT